MSSPPITLAQRHAGQVAFTVIGPGMTSAGKALGIAAALGRLGAAMAAIIQEGVSDTILVAGDQHRTADSVADDIIANGEVSNSAFSFAAKSGSP
jgi:hypothetical protein